MILYQSSYLSLEFVEESQLLKVIWSAKTADMQDAEFRQEMLVYAETVVRQQPANMLVDTRHFLLIVLPDTQQWVNEHIHPRSQAAGIKHIAYLMSKDLFAQTSIEQTMEEGDAHKMFDTRYFDDEAKALEWLSA